MKRLLLALFSLLSTTVLAQNNIHSYWVTGDGENVKKNDLTHWTATSSNSNWVLDTVRLYAARNEIVSYQVHFRTSATTDVTDLDVYLDTLSKSSSERISNALWDSDMFNYVGRHIEVFTMAYTDSLRYRSQCSGTWQSCPGKPISDALTWSEDLWGTNQYADTLYYGHLPFALIPKEVSFKGTTSVYGGMPMDVAKNRIQAVWVDVYVPRNANAGYYVGNMRVYQNASPTLTHVIPVKLRVYNTMISDTTFMPTWAYSTGDYGNRQPTVTDQASNAGWGGGPQYWTQADRWFKFAHRHRIDLTASAYADTFRSQIVKYYNGRAFSSLRGYDGPGQGLGQRVYPIGPYDESNGPSYTISQVYSDGMDQSGFTPNTEAGWRAAADKWAQILVDSGLGTNWNGYYKFFKYLIDEPDEVDDLVYMLDGKATWLANNPGVGNAIKSFSTTYVLDNGPNSYSSRAPAYYDNLTWIGVAGHAGGWKALGREGFIRNAARYWRSLGKGIVFVSGGWPSMGQYQLLDMPMIEGLSMFWIASIFPEVDAVYFWHSDYLTNEIGFGGGAKKNYWIGNDEHLSSGGMRGFSIANASNTNPIVLTTTTSHNYWADVVYSVLIKGVTGNTAANGYRYVIKRSGDPSNQLKVYSNYEATSGVSGNGAYTGGGSVVPVEGTVMRGEGTLMLSGRDPIYPESDKQFNGPIATITMKTARRGIQDYNLIYQAKRSLGWDAIKSIVHTPMPTASDSFAGSYTHAYNSYTPFSLRGEDYQAARIQLLNAMDGVENQVVPTINTWLVSPTYGEPPVNVTIQWDVSNATSLTLNGTSVNSSGAMYEDVYATKSFTLIAYNGDASVSRSTEVVISSTTQEYITNGDFETADGWYGTATGGTGNAWERATSPSPHGGTYLWKATHGSDLGTWNQTYQAPTSTYNFAIESGQAYDIGFWAYASSAGGKLRVRLVDASSYAVYYDEIYDLGTSWAEISDQWISGYTAGAVFLQFLHSGGVDDYGLVSGYTYIDDVSISRMSSSTIGPTTISTPVDGSTGVGSTVVLSWGAIGSASGYWYQVDNNSDFSSPFVQDTVLGTSETIGDLSTGGTTYYARVMVLSNLGNSIWSDTVDFTTYSGAPSQVPNLISPPYGTVGLGPTSELVWSRTTDCVFYTIQVATEPTFIQPNYTYVTIDPDTIVTLNEGEWQFPLQYKTTYYWRVCGSNLSGNSSWSSTGLFRTGSRIGIRKDKAGAGIK